jgi:multimeric flavodoxin WrbA
MKNNIVIVNFSNRNDGNCSFIAHYLNDILNDSSVYEFGKMNVSNCGNCNYECLNGKSCIINDDLSELIKMLLESKEIIFVVPNYCGYPCSNYFVYNERICGKLASDRELFTFYLNIPKRFVVVSNGDITQFNQPFLYQINRNEKLNFIQIKSRDYSFSSTSLWSNNDDVKAKLSSYIFNK